MFAYFHITSSVHNVCIMCLCVYVCVHTCSLLGQLTLESFPHGNISQTPFTNLTYAKQKKPVQHKLWSITFIFFCWPVLMCQRASGFCHLSRSALGEWFASGDVPFQP